MVSVAKHLVPRNLKGSWFTCTFLMLRETAHRDWQGKHRRSMRWLCRMSPVKKKSKTNGVSQTTSLFIQPETPAHAMMLLTCRIFPAQITQYGNIFTDISQRFDVLNISAYLTSQGFLMWLVRNENQAGITARLRLGWVYCKQSDYLYSCQKQTIMAFASQNTMVAARMQWHLQALQGTQVLSVATVFPGA